MMPCPSSPKDRLMADNMETGSRGELPGLVVAPSLRTHRSGLLFLGQFLPGQARPGHVVSKFWMRAWGDSCPQ